MSRNYKIALLIVVVVISLIGGIVGGILMRSYLLNSSFQVPLFGDINLGGNYSQGSLIISQPRNVVVEQSDRINQVFRDAQRSLLSIYIKKPSSSDAVKGVVNLANEYFAREQVGQGLVLTNDGWMVTALKIAAANNYVVINNEGVVLDLDQIIFDDETQLSFVKVKTNNLAAVEFMERNLLSVGQLVVSVNNNTAQPSYIENVAYHANKNIIRSSEQLDELIKISAQSLQKGDVQFALNGAVIGIYDKDSVVIPVDQVTKLLFNILKTGIITRPLLGVNYVNLYDLKSAKNFKGVLLYNINNLPAVTAGSPAAQAGLKAGDVILEVNGFTVDQGSSLSELIYKYQPGDEIKLRILREEEENIIPVVLDEKK